MIRTTVLPAVSKALTFVGIRTCDIAWVGRKSGKPFHTTVWYQPEDNGVRIRVGKPETKTWWRNFTGDGWPITVTINGIARDGHGRVEGTLPGKILVNVTWTSAE